MKLKNRIGRAVPLGTVRYLGTFLDDPGQVSVVAAPASWPPAISATATA
ncbi:hypothetical protein ABZ454_35595 [Streptomyces sp. NPDC005803]